VIAGRRLSTVGVTLFALTLSAYSFDHFLYAKEALDTFPHGCLTDILVVLTGAALFCSGIAILLNIKRRLAATLLGIMIFIWVVILHIPYALSALLPGTRRVTSAFLALAYCGIAFVIAQVNSTRV